MDFKDIHIGSLIKKKMEEKRIDSHRICNFLNASNKEVEDMLNSHSLDSKTLLRWSKLLEYDFFRIYSQHLILYAPVTHFSENNVKNSEVSVLPVFRKNVYTLEIIDFILEQIRSKALTKTEVIEKYKIPKTTLYKWTSKYGKSNL
ncbi:transposase [Chryseobacterium sp. Mn2064]|uniref:transposase n=1 Tax=Chryseobacterium sp. Mn2064 TaxID=3395263 RepID=UPI003BE29932